jgi:hypothetical protein
MRSIRTALLAPSLIALVAAAPASAARFGPKVDNPWFPLTPGTTLVYDGIKDGKRTHDRFRITHRTKVIDGARCVVIDDRVYEDGHLAERTTDYYAQARGGAVWYFGEDTAELDAAGHVVSRAGSWHSGRKGARAGIFMPAHPRVGEHHFQEHDPGNAQDEFRVLTRNARITVPYGSFTHALRTREWTALEPGVVDSKVYVRGIGQVYEGSVKGPKERSKLVAIER